MYQRIDADYYGYRDDDDGLLERLERTEELKRTNDCLCYAFNSLLMQ
jgi:hypothetical protein